MYGLNVKPLRGAVAAMVLTLFMAQVSPVSAAPKPNDRCQKAGRERVTAAGTLRCKSVGGVLRWQLVKVSTGDYKVGDVGPGGGIVIYVARQMFASPGSDCASSCRYLEAAPRPVGGDPWLRWAPDEYPWTNLFKSYQTGTGIGSGMTNTIAILEQGGSSGTAADYAYGYVNGGKTDWHLPSKDELNEFWKARYLVRATLGEDYWSSSQGRDNHNSWIQYFAIVEKPPFPLDGKQTDVTKTNELPVRPVRAF